MHDFQLNGKAQACAIGAASFAARTDSPLARGGRGAAPTIKCSPAFDVFSTPQIQPVPRDGGQVKHGPAAGSAKTQLILRLRGWNANIGPNAGQAINPFMSERRGKQTRGRRGNQRALEVAGRNAEFFLEPKLHLAGLASGLTHLISKVSLLSRSSRGKSGGWFTYLGQLPFSFGLLPP